jgi:hypothetical protein
VGQSAEVKNLQRQVEVLTSLGQTLAELVKYAPAERRTIYRRVANTFNEASGDVGDAAFAVVGMAIALREEWKGPVPVAASELFAVLDAYAEALDDSPLNEPVLRLVGSGT